MDYCRLAGCSRPPLRVFLIIDNRPDCPRLLRRVGPDSQHHQLDTARTRRLLQIPQNLGSDHRHPTRIRPELHRLQRNLPRLRFSVYADDPNQPMGFTSTNHDSCPLSDFRTCNIHLSDRLGERICSSWKTPSHCKSLNVSGVRTMVESENDPGENTAPVLS